MHVDPKRDAQKTEDSGATAKPSAAKGVTKSDGAPQSRTDKASPAKPNGGHRPRQDSLDRERAANEGMTAPEEP